jgi:hypothetical protein
LALLMICLNNTLPEELQDPALIGMSQIKRKKKYAKLMRMERNYGPMDPKIKISHDPEIEQFKKEAAAARVRLEAAMKETVWKVMDQAIQELVDKEDIIETTARQCIVGYIIDALETNNILQEKAFTPWLKKSK